MIQITIGSNDFSQVSGKVQTSGSITEVARKMTMEILRPNVDPNIIIPPISLGDPILIMDDATEVFHGVVFEVEVDDNQANQTITAYDPLIYLCKSESAQTVFQKQSAEKITSALASEVELPVGKLASTGTALNLNVRGKNIYEAMMEAYTAASKVTGEKYYPVYKNNAMHILEVGEMTNPVVEYLDEPVVGAMLGVKYKETLEELVSKVKVIGDLKEKTSEAEKDSGKYGTVQKIYKKENDKSPGAAARNMLKGVKTEAEIQCVGSWDYRTGYSVNVKTPLINSVFYITADSHTYEDGIHLCTLTLSYVAEMDEKESSKGGV